MRFYDLVFLICLSVAVSPGFEISTTVRAEITDDLTRAIELEHQGQIRKAEQILLRAVRTAESADNGSLELALVLNNLAVLYLSADRHADAERHFKRSIRILQALPGELPEQMLARTSLHLAALYLETERVGEAAKLNVPSILETLRSPEDKVRARTTLAALSAARKELSAAERIYVEVLSFWVEPSRAASNQPEIATTLNNLGVIALWQGRTDVARERLEQSFAIWQRIEGPKGPDVIKSMTNIGTAYMQAKDYESSAMWLARSTEFARSTFGEFHPFTVGLHFAHAEALKKAGRKAEAKEIARAAAAARRMMPSPSTADYTLDYREEMKVRQDRRR